MNNMIAGIFIKICFLYLLLSLFSIYNLLYVVFIRVLVRLKLYDLSKMKAKTDDKYFILHPEKFTYSSLEQDLKNSKYKFYWKIDCNKIK